MGNLTGCQGDLDRLIHVKGKAELIVSSKIGAAAYKFSPDMTKVIFTFSEGDEANRWGFINLEGSKRQIELFTDCKCGVRNVIWLNDIFFVSNGRCHQCSLLVDSRDFTTRRLASELVTAPVEDELIVSWKATDSLYHLPYFGDQRGWLLVLDSTTPRYYSLELSGPDATALLIELGDAPIVVERIVHGPKVYSLDGTMYAEHGSTGLPLRIYSRDGKLLAEARSARSRATIGVHGWTPDGKGVYFIVSAPDFPYQPEPLFLLRLP